MVNAVQAVVGPVECVTQRCSTGERALLHEPNCGAAAISSGGQGSRPQGRCQHASSARLKPASCSEIRAAPHPCSSPGGRYISVTVGPVLVSNADSVLEVYQRMKSDSRLRYFL